METQRARGRRRGRAAFKALALAALLPVAVSCATAAPSPTPSAPQASPSATAPLATTSPDPATPAVTAGPTAPAPPESPAGSPGATPTEQPPSPSPTVPAGRIAWDGEVRLFAGATGEAGIVRTGAASALVVWEDGRAVYARRTADGGRTWSPRSTLVSGVEHYPSVAGVGRDVDLAYVQSVRCPTDGSRARRLFYRRSADGGETWGPARAMTSACSQIADQDVARHAGGRVSVVWTGLYSGQMFTRTSTDGGTTFGSARSAGRTGNSEPGPRTFYGADPALAIGDGVMYLAYTAGPDVLAVRHSRNGGATWSSPVQFAASTGPAFASLVAAESRAILGYSSTASGHSLATYRRTVDRGGTWSGPRPLVPATREEFSSSPRFAYQQGLLAALVKHGSPGASPVWHLQSTDFGATWSARSRVSIAHTGRPDPDPGGVAILDGRHVALYREPLTGGLWVRRTVR